MADSELATPRRLFEHEQRLAGLEARMTGLEATVCGIQSAVQTQNATIDRNTEAVNRNTVAVTDLAARRDQERQDREAQRATDQQAIAGMGVRVAAIAVGVTLLLWLLGHFWK